MKYIRTKDGIYDETKVCLITDAMTNEIFVEKMIDGYTSHLEKVIAQSDKPEELCDGFYNDILNDFDCFGFDGLYIYNDFESFKEDWKCYRTYDNWQGNGYGFIKTDKGLIYVAKMNEKGEFELI